MWRFLEPTLLQAPILGLSLSKQPFSVDLLNPKFRWWRNNENRSFRSLNNRTQKKSYHFAKWVPLIRGSTPMPGGFWDTVTVGYWRFVCTDCTPCVGLLTKSKSFKFGRLAFGAWDLHRFRLTDPASLINAKPRHTHSNENTLYRYTESLHCISLPKFDKQT